MPFIASESKQTCRATMRGWYEFSLNSERDRLLITNSAGAHAEVKVSPDGTVHSTFFTRLGNQILVSGNAHTKHLKLVTADGACVMDASPSPVQ